MSRTWRRTRRTGRAPTAESARARRQPARKRGCIKPCTITKIPTSARGSKSSHCTVYELFCIPRHKGERTARTSGSTKSRSRRADSGHSMAQRGGSHLRLDGVQEHAAPAVGRGRCLQASHLGSLLRLACRAGTDDHRLGARGGSANSMCQPDRYWTWPQHPAAAALEQAEMP